MKTNIVPILFLAMLVPSQTWSQSMGNISTAGSSRPWLLSKGAAARESKRFTLQSWLENKDRSALMDMWLTINTPSPYEFIVGGTLYNYTLKTEANKIPGADIKHQSSSGEISAYAKFVGITGEYSNNIEEHFNDVTGIFNLRVFGNAVQSSHLTFHYGLRTRTADDKSNRLDQQFPAVTLQIYLMKYFGIQGNYRSYLPVTDQVFGETQGDELTAGAFIEFGSFRLFGDWYQERQNSKLNSIETKTDRTGSKAGLKLFF